MHNWSKENGLHHRKCARILCGITFGLAQYMVVFVYAWRLDVPFFVAHGIVFVLAIRMRMTGEMVKTAVGFIGVAVGMCLRPNFSSRCCAADRGLPRVLLYRAVRRSLL